VSSLTESDDPAGRARHDAALSQAAGLIGQAPTVQAIRTDEYPTKAARPAWSVLDTAKLRDAFDIALPDWQAALGGVILESTQHQV